MLIGHFSRKPMAAVVNGEVVSDPVDVHGNEVKVQSEGGHVAVGGPGPNAIRLEVMQAEELGFAVLTVVEDEANLSYTIQRVDRGGEPPGDPQGERARIDGILEPHIRDQGLRSRVRDEVISELGG